MDSSSCFRNNNFEEAVTRITHNSEIKGLNFGEPEREVAWMV